MNLEKPREVATPHLPVSGQISAEAAQHGRQILGTRLLRSLRLIQRGQHPNGEILSFRRDQDGNYRYHRSPFISTFIHEALGCFDPGSFWWQEGSLSLIPRDARNWFLHSLLDMRSRIRGYLAWQQESSGYWRFFGRGSGIDPDVNTTIYASLALQEGYQGRHLGRRARELDTVQSFRAVHGKYYTFYRPGYGGYGWMDPNGRPMQGFDRVVNADVLRYLCLAGLTGDPDTEILVKYLWEELTTTREEDGTPLYPNPLSFYYSLARTWRETGLSGLTELADEMMPHLLRLQGDDGDFHGPLSTALGGLAMIHLDYLGSELQTTRRAILRGLQPNGGWEYEDFIIDGFGSPALTTALSMAFLARYDCLLGWRDP
jgi:hypothetical protein